MRMNQLSETDKRDSKKSQYYGLQTDPVIEKHGTHISIHPDQSNVYHASILGVRNAGTQSMMQRYLFAKCRTATRSRGALFRSRSYEIRRAEARQIRRARDIEHKVLTGLIARRAIGVDHEESVARQRSSSGRE